jgi:exopolysaccharide production protein ExoZ
MILGIQYLRALAALMVVFHHSRNYFGADGLELTSVGAAGVDIFFVISGFVMAYSTRNFDNNGRLAVQATHFLQNRIIRIVPLYWLALLWQAQGEIISGAITPGLIGDFFFIPRFLPPDYMYIWPVLAPGWTLNYEMFFYVLFGVAMLTAKARYVLMAVVFMTLATLGLFIQSHNAIIRFYTSPLLLEFMFGILLYRGRDYYAGLVSGNIAPVVLMVGFIVLAIPNQLFGGAIGRVVADGIPAAFIVGSAIIVFENKRLPSLQLLGDASYSIYITHIFALAFAVHYADLLKLSDPSPFNMVLGIGMQMIVATILGVIVHKVIEKPVTSFLQSRIKKRQARVLALG